jgi:hypothetical protein
VLAVRPQSTKNAYGNTKTCGSGAALEWAMWCVASAGEMVYGLLTRPDKEVYDQIVTPEKACPPAGAPLEPQTQAGDASGPINDKKTQKDARGPPRAAVR